MLLKFLRNITQEAVTLMKPYLTDVMKRALMCLMTTTFGSCYSTILKLLNMSGLRKFQHHQKYFYQVKVLQANKITKLQDSIWCNE